MPLWYWFLMTAIAAYFLGLVVGIYGGIRYERDRRADV
jgi:hypothetical protein